MQYVQFMHDSKLFTAANLHGLWNGQGETDTEDRLRQSQKVRAFLDTQEGAKILCGDFSLLPDTKSLVILTEDMVDLVKEHGVTLTRSLYYTKPEKFADYILMSPDLTVIDFKMLQDAVSDHLPLTVEIK